MLERCIEQFVDLVLVSQITAVQHHIGAQLLGIPARAAL